MDLTVYSKLFEIVAPISLIVLIGCWLGLQSDKIDTVGISRLVMLVGTPALVFSTITTTDLPTALLLEVALGALCVCLTAILFATVSLRLMNHSLSSYLPAITMPNSGSLGLPLVLLAFGDDGLAFGVAFYVLIAIFQYTVMPIVVAGKFSIKSVVQEPLIWAVISALVFLLSSTRVPAVIADTTGILGGMMIPVMLLLLGVSIAKLGFNDLKKSFNLAVLRLVIGVAAGLSVIFLLGTSGVASGTILLMSAMPSALVTYVIAARYDRDPEQVAGLVVTSTVVTLIVLPLILLAAIQLASI